MDELSFRGPGQVRVSRTHFVWAAVGVLVEAIGAYVQLGAVGMCWLVGATVVFLGLPILSWLRSRCTVGVDGIFICWGLGRGRTYPWREIRWIDVRETKGNAGSTALAVRIFTTSGRRRSLPGLQHNGVYPSPSFHADYARVVRWWERSTEVEARVRPTKQARDWFSPAVVGVLLTISLIAFLIAGPALRG
ncbi:hypothetical protein [Streptomyces xanthochromogenes]|uniref:PH domain-containing protein n=1 Tax=Streptomyces xanthochromogenes TaxID=67384 RepID=A0ABQ2ZGY7_9ACTN|nr:hypothetical protein [Streptomyces xanthochromogenes]GGY13125.1 hypothetical protein GCM10010326_00370 [Streptomyces xanthochromogenes]